MPPGSPWNMDALCIPYSPHAHPPMVVVPEMVCKTSCYQGFSPQPSHGRHRPSADGTGKFYLDVQLVQRAQESPPLSRPPSSFPLPEGTLKVQCHVSLESSTLPRPAHPFTPLHWGGGEGCEEVGGLEELDQNGTCTDSSVHCPSSGQRPRRGLKRRGLDSSWGSRLLP